VRRFQFAVKYRNFITLFEIPSLQVKALYKASSKVAPDCGRRPSLINCTDYTPTKFQLCTKLLSWKKSFAFKVIMNFSAFTKDLGVDEMIILKCF
jgi:hypothetical protein